MNNNLKHRCLTADELGLTEDEWSNIMIELHRPQSLKPITYHYIDCATGEMKVSDAPITCTIVFKGDFNDILK